MALRLLRIISVLIVLAGFAGGGVLLWGQSQFKAPGPHAEDKIVILPAGANVRTIAQALADENIIANEFIFEIGARLSERSRLLKAGEFRFPARASMDQVVDILVEGKVVIHRFTLPEGLVVREVLAILRDNKILTGTIAKAPSEGSLLPETYHFTRGDSRDKLLARMQADMQRTLNALWQGRDKNLPIATPAEAIILASIVEKETGRADERARVAGVFVNRLRKGMKLQSDPTVSYGITLGKKPLGRKLNRKDLAAPSAFNTYVIAALPPGPIANPGKAAIEAVLKPMATKDLYFVADGKGGHRFAETYAQHRKNVLLFRKATK